ncbi:MAG: isocitrate/isopropylmalate family dehydrogenase [Acidobacteria bacterium]|nr:isocitrate/isopropylmalate family dehydrogenase [Acidobacteriota bacterium]
MIKVKKTIVLLPGDGIGPEVTAAAAAVLRDCAGELGHNFALEERPIGGAALDAFGDPLPEEALRTCHEADAILLGAVGGPRWDAQPLDRRPESGLLRLRKELNLYINLRPIRLHEPLRNLSPLAPAAGSGAAATGRSANRVASPRARVHGEPPRARSSMVDESVTAGPGERSGARRWPRSSHGVCLAIASISKRGCGEPSRPGGTAMKIALDKITS